MKTSKLITYLIGSIAIVILMVFIANFAPILLLASRSVPTTQTPPTTMPTKNAPTTMQAVVSIIGTPTISSSSINMTASQETTTEISWCTFDAQAVPAQAILPLDAYTFAEPRIVLTSTTEVALLQWISGTQSLLLRSHPVSDSPKRVIETFNPQTGERRRYVEAQLTSFEPVWLDTDQSVLFVERLPDGKQMLRLSHGIDQPVIDLATDIPSGAIVVDAVHQQIVRLNRTAVQQLQTVDVSYSDPTLTAQTLGLATLDLSGRPGMDLNPAGTHIAIYSYEGFYIQDRATGQICRLDLGQVGTDKRQGFWPRWSDDDRYMALITTYGIREGDMLRISELMIIDMATGEKRGIDFDGRYVYSSYWLPDTYTFLITVADENEPNSGLKNLYLVDAVAGKVKDILPDHRFSTNNLGIQWTTNEKNIFVSCGQFASKQSESDEWRICEIEVEVRQ